MNTPYERVHAPTPRYESYHNIPHRACRCGGVVTARVAMVAHYQCGHLESSLAIRALSLSMKLFAAALSPEAVVRVVAKQKYNRSCTNDVWKCKASVKYFQTDTFISDTVAVQLICNFV